MEYLLKQTKTDDNSLKAYAKLLSSVFTYTNKFTYEYLKWQYKLNPNGEVLGYDAFYNNELVAHYVTIPVIYLINGVETKGLLSLNTATHPNHQGKGMFTRLAAKTYETAKENGYSFVIGVANQNSTHGFLNKLGFALITSLDVKTGTGSISYSTKNYQFKPLWNEKSLSWRLNNPSTKYFKNKNCVLAKASKLNIYAQLTTREITLIPTITTKKPPFTLWIGLAKNIKNKGLFISLPQKLKPAPLNLIFKSLNNDISVLKKEDILFELIDFDVY
jgi:GNAT superfamily N-acetyltransferase